jgi:polysaccharide export outer membrane protein
MGDRKRSLSVEAIIPLREAHMSHLATSLKRFLICLLVVFPVTTQVRAARKQKYVMPPPEFFQARMAHDITIQPGDTIAIAAYYSPELNKTVRVREDGKISLPLLQGVQASGLTPEQLQQALTVAYSQEFKHPSITVDLITAANSSVYVTGEVSLPGPKEIHGRMTVAMALASAQVLSKSGKAQSTFLIRAIAPGHYSVYKIDASLPSGSAQGIEVTAGDILFVPKKVIAKADDFVDMWIRELLPGTASASVIFTPGAVAAIQ